MGLAFSLLWASGLEAQGGRPTGTITAARELFVEGARAAREGKWAEARDAFSRSYDLYPKPLTLYNLAASQANVGQLVEATESYRAFLLQAGDASELAYQDRAKAALAELEPRLPRVRFRVNGLLGGDALRLDGKALARAALATRLPVNPGDHRLSVMRGDETVTDKSFALTEGQRIEVTLEVPPPPEPEVAPPADGADAALAVPTPSESVGAAVTQDAPIPTIPSETQETREDSGGVASKWWFWTLIGGAVATAVVVGVVASSGGKADPFMGNVDPGFLEVP